MVAISVLPSYAFYTWTPKTAGLLLRNAPLLLLAWNLREHWRFLDLLDPRRPVKTSTFT